MPFERIRFMTLRQRLLLLTMLTSGTGLHIGCMTFLIYDARVSRELKLQSVQSIADLMRINTSAALQFNDPSGGKMLLEALDTQRDIRAGILYQQNGAFFASYLRQDVAGSFKIPQGPEMGTIWKPDVLIHTIPVYKRIFK